MKSRFKYTYDDWLNDKIDKKIFGTNILEISNGLVTLCYELKEISITDYNKIKDCQEEAFNLAVSISLESLISHFIKEYSKSENSTEYLLITIEENQNILQKDKQIYKSILTNKKSYSTIKGSQYTKMIHESNEYNTKKGYLSVQFLDNYQRLYTLYKFNDWLLRFKTNLEITHKSKQYKNNDLIKKISHFGEVTTEDLINDYWEFLAWAQKENPNVSEEFILEKEIKTTKNALEKIQNDNLKDLKLEIALNEKITFLNTRIKSIKPSEQIKIIGFNNKISKEAILKLFNELVGNFIDKNTKQEDFTVIFNPDPLPTGFIPIKWIRAKNLLVYFIDQLQINNLIIDMDFWSKAKTFFYNVHNLKQIKGNYLNNKTGKPKNSSLIDNIIQSLI